MSLPWVGLLPKPGDTYGPDWAQMITAQQLAEKLRMQRKEESGYNALGALYGDPANLDERGNLRPGVLQQAMGSGAVPAKIGMEFMGDQSKIMQQQAASTAAGVKVRDQNRDWLLDTVTAPSYAEYDRVLAATGDPVQATAAGQKVYTEGLAQARADGRLTPQEAQTLMPTFDPNRARANLQGRKGLEKQIAEARDFETKIDHGRSPPVEYRVYKDGRTTDIQGVAAYTPTGVGETKGAEAQLYSAQVDDGQGGKKSITMRMGPTGAFVDVNTGEAVREYSGVHKIGTRAEEGTVAEPTGPTNLQGQAYLDALPKSRADQIKGYAEGRIQFPGSFSLRSPYWQKMVADITQYDPTFDAVNYASRASTRRDFTSGPASRNVTSLNTAIGHLGRLQKAGEALNNTWSPAYNTVANFLSVQTGDPRVKEFQLARQAVASELERAFRGTGGSLTGIQEWQRSLDAAGSPEQIRGAVATAVDLLASRVDSVGEAYRRGMGTTADVTELLTPAARKTLAMLPGGEEILNLGGLRPQGPRGETAPRGTAPTATAKIPAAPGASPAATPGANIPPIDMVPQARRRDGEVVQFRDPSTGEVKNFVVIDGGRSLKAAP